MKCPHCLVEFHDIPKEYELGNDIDGNWDVVSVNCSNCNRNVYNLRRYDWELTTKIVSKNYQFRPIGINRSPVPKEVPEKIKIDYIEACLVLDQSPKASAALSRRCLQNIIREHLGIQKKDLFTEIQAVIDDQKMPSDILDSIDAVRNIGNFAAHPIKSNSTGEIVDVEPQEAEWNLDVLEMIFDFLFVRPAVVKEKRDKLNQKLTDTGKKTMK